MKRKGPRRDSRKQQFWQDAVRQWRRSGQSIREFCRDNALSEPSFYAWQRELAQRRRASDNASRPRGVAACARTAAAASFLPVRVVGPAASSPTVTEAGRPLAAAGVEIVLDHGRTVRVAAGFDRQTLADVLAVLPAAAGPTRWSPLRCNRNASPLSVHPLPNVYCRPQRHLSIPLAMVVTLRSISLFPSAVS